MLELCHGRCRNAMPVDLVCWGRRHHDRIVVTTHFIGNSHVDGLARLLLPAFPRNRFCSANCLTLRNYVCVLEPLSRSPVVPDDGGSTVSLGNGAAESPPNITSDAPLMTGMSLNNYNKKAVRRGRKSLGVQCTPVFSVNQTKNQVSSARIQSGS